MIKTCGIVYKSTGSWYTVKSCDGVFYECRVRGKIRLQGLKTTNPVAVGDKVDIEIENDGNEVWIISIQDRKNYIIRKSSNLSHQYQIIAANLDQALLMVSITKPKTAIGFIDRFLITAEAYRIPVTILFNKVDIYNDEELYELDYLTEIYKNIGYNCINTSTLENINIDIVKSILDRKTSLISGNSGVGKSSLINTINPELNLKTGKISDVHEKGMHTTTFAEMFDLNNETKIIDTPGIKGFGIIDIDKDEIYHFFPEIFNISKECQFHNCTHVHEPKCAVKKAVEDNRISQLRYESYLSVFFDEDVKYRQ